jgi:16S rRNA G966 N2-methylase RsmD
VLTGLAGVQSAMDRPLRTGADLAPVLTALRGLRELSGEEAEEVAGEVDVRLAQVLASVRKAPVEITVSGWPRGFGAAEREQLLGVGPGLPLTPLAAALLLQQLQGLALGGGELSMVVHLGPDEVLPVPGRSARADLRRGRGASWLPHVDAVGRFSATPEPIATRQAELLASVHQGLVLDPFCGCGANTIALARAGFDVLAIERDPVRARLAGRNARELGVARRVTVRTGDAMRLLPGLLAEHPSSALVLDPPWGAAEGVERLALTWDNFVPAALWPMVHPSQSVLAKLPRDFDVETLPDPGRWDLQWEFGAAAAGAQHVVKLVTALRAET